MNTDKLRRSAGEAAGAHEGMRKAYAEERDAQARALHSLVEVVRPALPALVSSMVIDVVDHAPVRGSFYRLAARKGELERALYLDAQGALWWFGAEGAKRWQQVTPDDASQAGIWPIEGWVGQLALSCEAAAKGRAAKGKEAAERRASKLWALHVLLEK